MAYVNKIDIETPERAHKTIERLLERLESKKGEMERLRADIARLDGDLYAAKHALDLERDGHLASNRELRQLSRYMEERVQEELRRRPQKQLSASKERIGLLKQENVDLKDTISELQGDVERLGRELRAWDKDFTIRVEREKSALEGEYFKRQKLLREREAERENRAASLEEEYRRKKGALEAEDARLQAEIRDQKQLLSMASRSWDMSVTEMRKHLETREARLQEEHAKGRKDLEETKKKFKEEAEWLSKRMAERQALQEKDLKTKVEQVQVLEKKVKQLNEALATAEKEHKDELQQKNTQYRETLIQMADALEKSKKEAALGVTPAKEEAAGKKEPEAVSPQGVGAILGSAAALGGVSPQDLVFGIAHQIRNPLAIIKSHAEHCINKLKPSEKDREPLDAIIRNCRSLGRRLDDLVDLTRPRELRTQPTSLTKILEQVAVLIQGRCAKQGVNLAQQFPAGLPNVSLDAEQFKEAMLHVLINALEALPNGGRIKLAMQAIPEKNLVRIDCVDNGTGIAPEHLKEIFRPFFSTKPGGVGLGLTLAAQIFGLHGGGMEAKSDLDKGTVISCYLPLIKE